MTPWRTRPARASEAPLLSALHAMAFPPAERWGPVAIAALLALPGAFGRVARTGEGTEEEAGAAGFVLARAAEEEAEVLTLAVDPARRRAGLGARLLDEAWDGARARGARRLFLEVSEGNAPARALYARLGAEAVGRRRRYYADGSDALVLRLGA